MTRPEIGIALTAARGRTTEYARARAYVAGTQRDVFPERAWKKELGRNLSQPRDQLGRLIVESLVSRLRPTTFSPRFPKVTGAQKDADLANAIWARNRMDEQAPEIQRTASTCGDAFVLVSEDRGRALIHRQDPDQCHIEYDPEFPGRRLWAAKWWVTDKRIRFNLYLPDGLYRYISNTEKTTGNMPSTSRAFSEYSADGQPHFQPNPLKSIPMFHLPNAAPTGSYGRSELDGLYSLIDQVNAGLCDLVLAMRTVGYPWRAVSGVKSEPQMPSLGAGLPDGALTLPALGEETFEDPSSFIDTDDDALEGGPNKLIELEDAAARLQQWDAAPLEGPIKFVDNLRQAIARNARRPMHALGLGSALATATEVTVAESLFLAELQARQTTFGNNFEDVIAYAVMLENSHNESGFTALAPLPELELSWEPAELKFEASQTDRMRLSIEAGLPLAEWLVKFLGYDEPDALAVEERKLTMAREAADAAGYALSAGYGAD